MNHTESRVTKGLPLTVQGILCIVDIDDCRDWDDRRHAVIYVDRLCIAGSGVDLNGCMSDEFHDELISRYAAWADGEDAAESEAIACDLAHEAGDTMCARFMGLQQHAAPGVM